MILTGVATWWPNEVHHMSVLHGYDPDFPRNLSKTLTVD
jgi:hypothetical protein